MNSRVGATVSQKAQAIWSEKLTGSERASGMSHSGQARDRIPSQAARSAGRISTLAAAARKRSSRFGSTLLAGS